MTTTNKEPITEEMIIAVMKNLGVDRKTAIKLIKAKHLY